jgi:hypothetical protein
MGLAQRSTVYRCVVSVFDDDAADTLVRAEVLLNLHVVTMNTAE